MIEKITRLVIPLAGVAGIIILELKALSLGIDGTLLAVALAAIAGICGYEIKELKIYSVLSKRRIN